MSSAVVRKANRSSSRRSEITCAYVIVYVLLLRFILPHSLVLFLQQTVSY